ncbi:MAG TPA: hypothetical protein PK055_00200 [Gammaproteobacteria bacterium]|nr:hypothetical protein [Xanthomonadales bacterium]MCB1593353.1 hypothetical protein [Xanthomonadales bacterium]HOP22624.1 hypothetical protein [Gammaproteobacteria bacterium]HPI94608.1 hypothetical protein [Gammaproteobacteria bacterium]HPQ86053.1 hypothetical protein [Gammaproteobacteria bacterium]
MKQLFAKSFIFIFFFISSAQAETYTYTGPNFNEFFGDYSASDFITGSFDTSSPLPANASYGDFSGLVTSWSFTDGQQTLTPANSYLAYFNMSTNSSGQPDEWLVSIYENQTLPTNINAPSGTTVSLIETAFTRNNLFQEIGSQDSNCSENNGPNGQCSGSATTGVNSATYLLAPSGNTSPGPGWGGSRPVVSVPVLSFWNLVVFGVLVLFVAYYQVHRRKSELN